MQIKSGCLEERFIEAYEYDTVNNENVLVFRVYATKRNNGLWEFPAPQIYCDKVYENNKQAYEAQILAFRNDCQMKIDESSSVLLTQISALQSDNELLMKAVADLADQR